MNRLPNRATHHHPAEASTGASSRAGLCRRFFNAWRRWEKKLRSMPLCYTLDRIGQVRKVGCWSWNARGMRPKRLRSADDGMTQIGTQEMQPMEDMGDAKCRIRPPLIAGVGPGISASRASSFGAWCGSGLACSRFEKA